MTLRERLATRLKHLKERYDRLMAEAQELRAEAEMVKIAHDQVTDAEEARLVELRELGVVKDVE